MCGLENADRVNNASPESPDSLSLHKSFNQGGAVFIVRSGRDYGYRVINVDEDPMQGKTMFSGVDHVS